ELYASELIELVKTKEPSKKYGDYFASAFRMKAGSSKGQTIFLLWSKEDQHWKIVSLTIADEADPKVIPTAAPALAKAETKPERVKGDPKAIEADPKFLYPWL